jgi:hypothetical protein
MSRCIICDHCNDFDPSYREIRWREKHKGFVCSVCYNEIEVTSYEILKNIHPELELGELPYEVDFDDETIQLERSDILE